MARARNIKPSFFTNDQLAELSFSTRLLFIGLWTIADRLGRLEDRPKRIKMKLFPADRVDVNRGLTDLADAGFITRYVIDNERFIQIGNFTKHQTPHVKEAESMIPAPDKHQTSSSNAETKTPDSLIPDSLQSESKDTTAQGIFAGTVLAGITQELGLKKLSPSAQREWTQHADLAFENGFTADEFIRCFADLRRKRSYTILPQYVTDGLPEFARSKSKIQRLPTPAENDAEAKKHNAHIRKAPKPVIVEGVK